ncbi:uncharacterized protein Z518_09282 [Rhinocladiella mackenziei CBS 650.93]|uniref:MFS transporter n=1 Tax=Rhinocladiella mackenziei CBS 650.93 TaxID=1442369 RepID=A0A0D2IE91_9EURO|nr:uncharacterized protein Z518_09282 [Rhinocladiella mackenziei CBS 650.93]KIX01556.1 hypothetical protein Z518_09282 [Rhinocladiella mackenziei CBS 650.93]
MFKATKLQIATYLLGVCPFSIAFLVFLNSSVSFVITDLIGREHGVGDAVGNLGFADELVALVACPMWGLLSDRMGLRFVCVSGYLIICLALALFVQARNVYPQLLLARLLFSLGGAAASTMVTAILPAIAASPSESPVDNGQTRGTPALAGNGHISSPSIASELTITPARISSRLSTHQSDRMSPAADSDIARSTSRMAGFVGMCTGCGALVALMIFLPLPAKFQYAGVDEKAALRYSFYIVAVVALILSIWCFFGLRRLQGEPDDSWSKSLDARDKRYASRLPRVLRLMLDNFQTSILTGFKRSEIAIGYLGGFVARASSVGISLFIPLLVNAMFLASDLCVGKESHADPGGLPDIKRRCPRAYVVASELTGVSQMVALIFAPIFGYWSAKVSRKELPLLVASIAGIVGYPLFANQFDPDDTHTAQRVAAFIAVCLVGISQIGAIVCSLGTLSKGILLETPKPTLIAPDTDSNANDPGTTENQPLLDGTQQQNTGEPLSALKGSVAGVYSLYGGAAILILTKIGGLLFDRVSVAAPFYIMAGFNAVLMLACATLSLWSSWEGRYERDEAIENVS